MATVLVATQSGCLVFNETGATDLELPERKFSAMATEADGCALAVIDGNEIWRRLPHGTWTKIATVDISLQSMVSKGETIFGGGMDEAAILRIAANGKTERLLGFDKCAGRNEWFASGPPLGVRSLAATCDGASIIAAVHVGGLPYSLDSGITWTPTVPVLFDVHMVGTHPSLPNFVAAASAIGLCVSTDAGLSWRVVSEGLEITNSLAVAILYDQVLFAVADGPFAKQSQIWRWGIGSPQAEQVRDGLPEWLEGKVDTAQIAVTGNRAAIVDGGGNLWLSSGSAKDWQRLATQVPYALGITILAD